MGTRMKTERTPNVGPVTLPSPATRATGREEICLFVRKHGIAASSRQAASECSTRKGVVCDSYNTAMFALQ